MRNGKSKKTRDVGPALAAMAPSQINPRAITSERLGALRRALDRFGDLSGFVFNRRTGRPISANQRLKVWQELGGELVVMERHAPDKRGTVARGHVLLDGERYIYREVDWPEPREKAALLAANNHAGEWQMAAVKKLLEEIEDDQLRGLTGFDTEELDKLLGKISADAAPQLDRAKELQKKWKVALGQLWQIGEHRLLCGDSLKQEDVVALLGKTFPALMVTDPPYGVDYDAKWRCKLDKFNRATGSFQNDHGVDWSPAYKLSGASVAYVWHAGRFGSEVEAGLKLSGFELVAQIIWSKPHFVLARGDYHWQHEPCWYAVKKGAPHHWQGARDQSTVWQIANALFQGKLAQAEDDKLKTGHGTQKPVECMARPIRNNSAKGDPVYDPFLGSGSTMVACENLKRKCRGIEISTEYCAVILQRMQDAFKLTGRLVHQART
jgi:DNA modification methylase